MTAAATLLALVIRDRRSDLADSRHTGFPEGRMSGGLKIAVADDETDTREYLQEYLAHLGHDVRAAADGRWLVELCREFAPDLIVTDFTMPLLNGLAAAAEVNRDRHVPVILISGRHDAESLDAA